MILKYYASIQLMPAILAHRWWVVAAIIVAVALFGRRVYCRFICPLGIAQDLVRGFVGKRRICSRLDGLPLRVAALPPAPVSTVIAYVKMKVWIFVRLMILAAFIVVGWQWLDPYAIASRAVCWFASPEFDWAVAAFALVPAIVVLLLAVLAGGRIWCNWICPIGTFLAFVGIRPWKGDKVKIERGEKGEMVRRGEKGEMVRRCGRGEKASGCAACRRCFK